MRHDKRDPNEALPLTTSAFLILLSLADAPKHGYSISKEVSLTTHGSVRLGSGTLYRQLRQMTIDGWIQEIEHPDTDAMGRRYYDLTHWGRRILKAEAGRLEFFVKLARERRVLPENTTRERRLIPSSV